MELLIFIGILLIIVVIFVLGKVIYATFSFIKKFFSTKSVGEKGIHYNLIN